MYSVTAAASAVEFEDIEEIDELPNEGRENDASRLRRKPLVENTGDLMPRFGLGELAGLGTGSAESLSE